MNLPKKKAGANCAGFMYEVKKPKSIKTQNKDVD